MYDTDVDLGTENQPLLPVGMYHVYGEELLRGRASDPDLSHLVAPEPVADGQLPTADIEAIRTTLSAAVDRLIEGELEQIPSYFVKAQAEELEKFIPIIQPVLEKQEALEQAMGKQDAPAPGLPSGMPTDPKAIAEMLKGIIAAAEVTATDGDHASVALSLPMMPEPMDLPLVRTDDGWLVEFPKFPPSGLLDAVRSGLQQSMPQVLAKLDELIARVGEGSLTPQQAQMELMPLLVPLQQSIMQAITQAGLADAPDSGNEVDEDERDAKADPEQGEEGDDPSAAEEDEP